MNMWLYSYGAVIGKSEYIHMPENGHVLYLIYMLIIMNILMVYHLKIMTNGKNLDSGKSSKQVEKILFL